MRKAKSPNSKTKKRSWKIDLLCSKTLKQPLSSNQVKKIVITALSSKSVFKIPRVVNEITIVFTDNKTIRKLNRTYRGKDAATDVLSFSSLENSKLFSFEKSLGSVVISVPMAKIQARKNKVAFKGEMAWLLIHGVLHLLGYDHENVSASEAKAMRKLESEIAGSLQKILDRVR